jgi:hypothetical protein
MTRDMELVRKLMIALAATERPLDSVMVRITGYTPEQISEHIRLLHEARLLDGSTVVGADRRLRWNELRLTWWGHDFIECARNEAIWRLAIDALGPESNTASLEVWRKTLLAASYRLVKHSPGE